MATASGFGFGALGYGCWYLMVGGVFPFIPRASLEIAGFNTTRSSGLWVELLSGRWSLGKTIR
jgi:hypothetical protein